MKVNDKILLDDGKKWTIKAISEKYIICTRPYNPKSTVFYTILDLENKVRNRHNMIFNPYDFKIQEDINECMKDLIDNKIQLSHRGSVKYTIMKEGI